MTPRRGWPQATLALVSLVVMACACGDADAAPAEPVDPYEDPRLVILDEGYFTFVGPAQLPSYRLRIPLGWELLPMNDAVEVRLLSRSTGNAALSVTRTQVQTPLAELSAAANAASVAAGYRRELVGDVRSVTVDGVEGISFDQLDTTAAPARRLRTAIVDRGTTRFAIGFAIDDGDGVDVDLMLVEDVVLGAWRWVDQAPPSPS